jgi:hypothetical protein
VREDKSDRERKSRSTSRKKKRVALRGWKKNRNSVVG